MEKDAITQFIGAFVVIMLGVIITGIVATNALSATALTTTTDTQTLTEARLGGGALNETYYFTLSKDARIGTFRYDDSANCGVSTLTLKTSNGTLLTEGATCGSNKDYVYTDNVNLNFCNSLGTNASASYTNTTTATYSSCPDTFVTGSFGRTAINLIPGFFGIAVMLVGVGLFYSVAKREGLI